MRLPNRPANIGELRERIASGELRESRVLEFKRQFPDNRTLAKQIAGLAAEGGVLVIGVAETEAGLTVTPLDCTGARERVEQVARDVPSPAIDLSSYILGNGKPDHGVLWIEIPASPEMLHEVDGTYYARGDTQTRPMRDAEVSDRMALRQQRSEGIAQALRDALEREEPVAPSLIGRTCVVARPIGASEEEFFERTAQRDSWESSVSELRKTRGLLGRAPDRYWGQISHRFVSPPRESLSSVQLAQFRDIELRESGAFSYLSYSLDWLDGHTGGVFPTATLRACLDAITVMGAVAKRTGQRRMWDIAFSISDVEGRAARTHARYFTSKHHVPIPRDRYSSHALGVSSDLLERDPRVVVEQLAGRFIDECGLEIGQEWPDPRERARSGDVG